MRPFIDWVCGTALACKFLLHPMACWLLVVMQGFGILDGVDPPPEVNVATLYPLILGILGIGGMRSWDKTKGVSTESIR